MRSVLVVLALAASAMAAGTWKTLASNVGTAATGIDFVDAKTGYLPVDANGEGTLCLKSTDGGNTWNPTEPHVDGLIWLDVAAYESNVIVSGAVDEYYSLDMGAHFNVSIGGGQSQSIRTMIDGNGKEIGFVAAGDFGLFSPKSGVAISTDGGITFTAYDAGQNTDARYAAAIASNGATVDTIYLAGGNWPESNTDDDQTTNDDPLNNDNNFVASSADSSVNFPGAKGSLALRRQRTSRLAFVRGADGVLRAEVDLSPRAPTNTSGFYAQMSKSEDGGKTWKSLYTSTDFYFNGGACWSTTECCFVGEADAGSNPGARIFCTKDGATFNQTYFQAGAEYSLLDFTTVPGSAGEGWAVGGTLTSSPSATFLHTVDFGNTWTVGGSISGSYAAAVDCVSSSACWSPTLQPLFQTSSVAGLVSSD